MRTAAATLLVISALAVAACGEVPPVPTLPGGLGSPPVASPVTSSRSTPGPTPTAEGTVALDVRGRVKGTCPAWPGGCGYWVTLVEAGGITHRAPLEHDPADMAKLTLGDGLPDTVAGGAHAVVFEVEEFSDAGEQAQDGTAYFPSYLSIACAHTFETGAAVGITVRVTFDGNGCTVRTVEAYE
jgi:hypothetical protein